MADGEGICWREWLASRITTGRVIRGEFSRWGGRVRLGWGMDDETRRARATGRAGERVRKSKQMSKRERGRKRERKRETDSVCGWCGARGVWCEAARAAHTVALDEKCSQRATAAGKFTRITRAKLNGEG